MEFKGHFGKGWACQAAELLRCCVCRHAGAGCAQLPACLACGVVAHRGVAGQSCGVTVRPGCSMLHNSQLVLAAWLGGGFNFSFPLTAGHSWSLGAAPLSPVPFSPLLLGFCTHVAAFSVLHYSTSALRALRQRLWCDCSPLRGAKLIPNSGC